jgi:deoxyribodipyrimidine photolyase-related protein
MQMEISLVFPHQLYKEHPAIKKGNKVFLIEDELYFSQYPFHKKKLVLHRATMKYYQNLLMDEGYEVEYIDCMNASLDKVLGNFKKGAAIHYADTSDYLLERRINRFAKKHELVLKKYESPNFLTTVDEINNYFGAGRRFFMADFYKFQRKRLGILVSNNEPAGGKWSFDEENRKKLPKSVYAPVMDEFDSEYLQEAIDYVEKQFPGNYGETGVFQFPLNHSQAEQMLKSFLEERFSHYGTYQDAISKQESFLFHSNISSSLNIGLLDPQQVVQTTLRYAGENKIAINSVEGFIRQVIGWREYIRAVYILKGVEERKKNYFNFNRKIPESFWKGTTRLDPIDSTIKRLNKTCYAHHIERLMVLGNFMLLCEFDPDEVYRWFMCFFIDAYDWVMVPNVYGMSQFADGGMMSTKPYISGSNYLIKMSDYKKGVWTEIWDALFWRFMIVHYDTFHQNPRLSFLLNTWNKFSPEKRENILNTAEKYLQKL